MRLSEIGITGLVDALALSVIFSRNCVCPLLGQTPAAANSTRQGSGQASPAKSYLQSARRALDAKDFTRAKAQLDLALRSDPKSAEAYEMLGLIEFQDGETARAIGHFKSALQFEPNSFSIHYNLALAFLRERRQQEGLQELERALELNPRHPEAAYNLGVVLLDLGKPEQAIGLLHQAKLFGSNRPDIAFNLVRADLAARRIDEARKDSEEGASIFGTDVEWRVAIGRLFLDSGQPHLALGHLEAALRLRPDSPEIRRALAAAYVEAQQAESALSLVRDATAAEDHFLLASAYHLLRRLPEAEQECRRAIEQSPRDPRYLLLEARLRQSRGDQATALGLLQQAISAKPEWPEPYYSSAVSYYFERRYSDARRSLTQALKLDPQSARSLFLYSATLVNEGRNGEAEEYLRQAIALEPENARFHYHLGALLLRDNRASEARPALEQAIRLKPDYAPPHYQLGKLLARAGENEAAARELEKAIGYQPDLVQAYYQLARVYAALNQTEKSGRMLETFNRLKKHETDEGQEFLENMNKEFLP